MPGADPPPISPLAGCSCPGRRPRWSSCPSRPQAPRCATMLRRPRGTFLSFPTNQPTMQWSNPKDDAARMREQERKRKGERETKGDFCLSSSPLALFLMQCLGFPPPPSLPCCCHQASRNCCNVVLGSFAVLLSLDTVLL